jgi:hypothetical protein
MDIFNRYNISVTCMKGVALVFILCLVMIGTVSADSIGMGTAQGIKVISTIDPHKISINQPQTSLMGMLSVTSTPSGASVMIDGSSTLNGAAIPVTNFNSLAIIPGQHTITLKHTGYSDYSSSFSVNPGGTASVDAQLQRVTVMVKQQNPAVVSGAVVRNIEFPGASENTPVPIPTLQPCPSGYTCESLAKAQSDYGTDGYTLYSSTLPCNYAGRTLSIEQVKEYCILPKKKLVARISLNSNIVKQAESVQEAGSGEGGPNPQIKPVEPGNRLYLVENTGGGQESSSSGSEKVVPPIEPVRPVPTIDKQTGTQNTGILAFFTGIFGGGTTAPYGPGGVPVSEKSAPVAAQRASGSDIKAISVNTSGPTDLVGSLFAWIFGKPVSQQPAVPADICVCGSGWVCTYAGNCDCHTCNGQCVDLKADKTNCGSCGLVCPTDYNCWNGKCFWDVGRCGTTADCDRTKARPPGLNEEWQCVNTYCTETCKAGYTFCDPVGGISGYCMDLQNNDDNCGSCNHFCGGGTSCQNGACVGP